MWRCLLTLAVALAAALGARVAAAEPEDGLHFRPDLAWRSGDHQVEVSLAGRYRFESWDARARRHDGFHGLRTRLATRYTFRDAIAAFAEAQYVALWGLSARSSGAAALYRRQTSGGDATDADELRLRQLYLELDLSGAMLRAGRQNLNFGTTVRYDDPDWRYLKLKRLSQRLVGTVGWTHVERAYDGLSAVASPLAGHSVHLFAARPTTGVFDVERGYRRQDDIGVAGVAWTVQRGTWLEHSELRAFGIAYQDTRDGRDGGLAGDVEVYTLGASLLSLHPVGPGRIDVLAWVAAQWGDFPGTGGRDLDHLAAAGVAEIGYRLGDFPARPWLRVGVNAASGDDDPNDGDHGTFFNLLPTNHLYYGYADQLAFQNLVDLIVQLKLEPFPRAGLELSWHRFWLVDDRDARYFGTGAFSTSAFGFGSTPSNNSKDVGHELDVVASYPLHRSVNLSAGYAYFWGGRVFGSSRRDTEWVFAQIRFAY